MIGRVGELCKKAVSVGALSTSECLEMLSLDESSPESDILIDTAYGAVRERNGNSCSIGV